ncbi:MAG: hypothetical protein IK095_03290, partial [Oscillospiraceae bacterium]|nr:hypothetical protein [Oscillospiraceae bacterium]
EPEPEPAFDPAGTYRGGGFTVTIREEDDRYTVTITCQTDDGNSIKWVFHGKFDENGKLSYKDCVKTSTVRNEDGETVEQTDYTDGSGSIAIDKGTGKLTWKDGKENYGKGVSFTKN